MDEQTPAQKHYESMKKAQAAYYKRLHPNPKPRGRPRKVKVEENKVEENKVEPI